MGTQKMIVSLRSLLDQRNATSGPYAGMTWKRLGVSVGGVYVLLAAVLFGVMLLLPNHGSVAPVTNTVQKIGVPIIPKKCSSAIDSAEIAVATTARLNVASGEYIRAERSGNKQRIKTALLEIREARAAFTSTNPAYVANRDNCLGNPRGIDLSVTQSGLN